MRIGAVVLSLVFSGSLFCSAEPLPSVSPEEAGMDAAAIERMHRFHERNISEKKVAGVVTLMMRDGKVVDFSALGMRDLEKELPMEENTIFRLYSMTKTITSTAVMLLVDEGLIDLNDPLEKYIPAFADQKVLIGGTVEEPELVDRERSVTIKMLLTHTDGFIYPGMGSSDDTLSKIYDATKPYSIESLEEAISVLAGLPLSCQPGTKWEYGAGIDILGRIIEVVSGETLGAFLEERFFEPMGMTDTGFTVPEDQRGRLAKIYMGNDEGNLVPFSEQSDGGMIVPFEMGGGGLYSTADDYGRFVQMLLNGGEFQGRQYLGKKTVEFMMTDHLAHLNNSSSVLNVSDGFGIGGSVRINQSQAPFLGSIGQYGWGGAASTTYRIDPSEKTVFIYMSQHMPMDQFGLNSKIHNTFQQTISE